MNSNNSFQTAQGRDRFPTPNFSYTDWRERFILTILQITCFAVIPMMVLSFPTTPNNDRVLFIGMYIGLVVITLLPMQYSARAYLLLLLPFAIGVNAILLWGPWADGNIFLLVCVVLSALLLERRTDIIILGISIFFMITVSILQQLDVFHFLAVGVPPTGPADWFGYCIDFVIMGVVIVAALGQFKGAFERVIVDLQRAFDALTLERRQLEDKVLERTDELENRTTQLRTASTVAKVMAEKQNIIELLESVVDLTSEKFGYYQVGLYILDEHKKTAFLQSASSAAGKQMIGQGFRIDPSKRNPISAVVSQNHYVISSDLDDAKYFRDANFPLTRSRMMLPLAVRGTILGILDMHSDQPRAFDAQDAEILQTLADLVAISFDNARLINETKSLLSQLEVNTTIQTERTWRKLTSRQRPAYQYTPAGVRPIFSTKKKVGDEDEGLHVPLILHGQKIGAVKLKRKGMVSQWSERERNLVEKIADQVALALENSRLVDEAQKSALRDQMIANISTRVRETLEIESVARTAATELLRAFDLKEAEILIGASQPDDPKI